MTGTLILVAGPSGAGKDTLITAAREKLSGDPRYVFPRRLVTRSADPGLEDHDTIGWDDFRHGVKTGAFALSWQAHGLGYALPGSIATDLSAGRVVVANVSRSVIATALTLFPQARVLIVDADAPIRASRLATRGRETATDVAERLTRDNVALPPEVRAVTIDNSGDLAAAVEAFLAEIRNVPGPRPSTGSG